MNKTFTWEGRCYQTKYNNMELLNIYLNFSNNTPFDQVVAEIQSTLGDKIMFCENQLSHPHSNSDSDSDMAQDSVTIVIKEENKGEIFAYLKAQGFKEV